MAVSWQALGRVLYRHGCAAQAEAAMQHALDIRAARLAAGDPVLARTRGALARAAGLRAAGVPAQACPPGIAVQ